MITFTVQDPRILVTEGSVESQGKELPPGRDKNTPSFKTLNITDKARHPLQHLFSSPGHQQFPHNHRHSWL